MKAVIFYPKTELEMTLIQNFASHNKLSAFNIDEESMKKLAAFELSKLAKKNPRAYATDEEIISIVEDAREERHGKRD